MKQSIIKISDLPNFMDVEEVMEVKGGAVSDNTEVCLIGSAVKCSATGSGLLCNVQGSGIVCTVEGSGLITGNKDN
jgi:hypothetical protein